ARLLAWTAEQPGQPARPACCQPASARQPALDSSWSTPATLEAPRVPRPRPGADGGTHAALSRGTVDQSSANLPTISARILWPGGTHTERACWYGSPGAPRTARSVLDEHAMARVDPHEHRFALIQGIEWKLAHAERL